VYPLSSRSALTFVLRLPDMSKPFLLQTDASSEGIGAILLQEECGVKHPVAFASKKLLPREKTKVGHEIKRLIG